MWSQALIASWRGRVRALARQSTTNTGRRKDMRHASMAIVIAIATYVEDTSLPCQASAAMVAVTLKSLQQVELSCYRSQCQAACSLS